MRIIDLFEEAKATPEREAILVKKYVGNECTLSLYYPDKDEVSSTLPFETMLMIADNHDMKAQYINIKGKLYDQLRFDEQYSDVLIYIPREDAYGREVIEFEGPEKYADLFADDSEKRIFVVVTGKCSELAKHILLT